MTLTASGGGTYRFSNGANQTGSGNTATVNTAGPYSVTVTGTNGCTATATTTMVGDQAAPTASLSNNGPLSCTKTSVTLTASGGGSYRFSAGASQIGSTNRASVITAGPYSVTVTGTNGCSAVASTTVTGDQTPPTASINPSATTLNCANPMVLLTASGGWTYRWDDNSTNALRTVSVGGTYSVTVAGANACTAIARATILMLVPPPPSLSLLVSGRVLQATAAGGVLFERVMVIDRINGYEIRQADSNATGFFPITRTGPYRLTVTDANGCRTTVEGRIDTLP